MAAAPNIDAPSLRAIIQDVFLLPELPGETLEQPFLTDLPKLLDYALTKCNVLFPQECSGKLRQCRNSISNFLSARADTSKIAEKSLFKLLRDNSAAPIPLYLRHHNAGIIIRWGLRQRRIEIFQLSPKVNAVTLASARLRRQFPEMSVAIEEEVAADKDFAQLIAETIAEMDTVEIPGLKPLKKCKGKMIEDKCDATLCDHLFDIFFPYLLTEKSDTRDVPIGASIVKHTRDFVLFVDDKKPVVRRSPVWLLLKVVLQQELRHEKSPKDYTLYKQFMLVFLSSLLDVACDRNFDSHTLHCMARKIGYRTWKLQGEASGAWMVAVESAVKRANDLLNTNWTNIVKADHTKRATKLPRFVSSATSCHVKHQELNKFLAKVREKPPSKAVSVAEPKSDIISWPPDKLPNMNDLAKESPESIMFNLIRIDQWVEDNLTSFVEANMNDISTCSDIKKFAIAYFKRASFAYKDYPDYMSVKYLTMLELWVACDMCAVARNPLLQEYTPLGVEGINLESLVFRTKREMLRLSWIENYLESRSSDALSMVAQYGTADCFGTRFAQASEQHQKLMTTIEDDMNQQKQDKSNELDKMKAKQKWHMEAHDNGKCDEVKCRVGTSSIPCERCNHLVIACDVTVEPLRSILPDDNNLAHTIAFELQVPPDISAWREFCFFLLLDVAGYEHGKQHCAESQDEISDDDLEENSDGDSDQNQDQAKDPKRKARPIVSYIRNYSGLARYFKLESKSRIVLASQPEKAMDRRPVTVRQDTQLSDICQSHPMKWKLFDAGQGRYIRRITERRLIQEMCSFAIFDGNELLRNALTDDDPDTPKNQNELISLRLEAENVMVLKHNEELGSLYFGDHVIWPKILRELRGTSIDWAAPETFLFMSQVIFEAGPKQGDGLDRKRHCQLNDEKFTTKFIQEIQRLLDIYTKSRSGRRPLAVFCIIAHKIITAAPESCRNGALEILTRVRKTCFSWLRDERQAGFERTAEMLETHLEIALIGAYTLAVDYKFLKDILSDNKGNVERYILATTTIYEHKSKVTSCFQKTLYSASLRLAVNATGILVGQVNAAESGGIRNGLSLICEQSMKLSPDDKYLSHVSGPWVKTCTKPLDQSTPKTLHLNLMTGEMLIDGKSPRHLHENYVNHEDFRALFGNLSPTVTSIDHPVYRYQFRHTFRGFSIEIGMREVHCEIEPSGLERELHVRATNGSDVFVLIPGQILSRPSFPFPKEYVSAHLHWHQITQGNPQIDFYPRTSPWDSSSIAWELKSRSRGWLLMQRGRDRVVMPTSLEHAQKLSNIFGHFITEEDFSVFVNQDDKILEAQLGTIGLNFFVNEGSSTIRSSEFENMVIDHDYSLETLIGLQPKLILCNQHDRKSRTLLVADGEEQALRTEAGHTEVTVAINQQTTIQTYTINEGLDKLLGNQTWRSKAYLAYLSALTSHCLPDPFTSTTGQETALEILTSGAILSFDSLDAEDQALLKKISQLSPERQIRKRPGASLPTLKWNDKLRPALHHEMYYTAVEQILEHAETLDSFAKRPKIERQKASENEARLREAAAIRFACFRVTGYSTHDGSLDADYYFRKPEPKRKKRGETSEEAGPLNYSKSEVFQRAYSAANGTKYQQRFPNKLPSAGNVLTHITRKGAVKGETRHYELQNLRYAGNWSNITESGFVQDFCSIHRALTSVSGIRNKYRLRLWLCTVAFSMDDGMANDLIPIISAVIGDPWGMLQIPKTTSYNTSIGHESDAAQLVTILNDAKTQSVPQQEVFDNETRDTAEEEFRKEQDDTISFLATQMAEKGDISLAGFERLLDVDKAKRAVGVRFNEWDLNKAWVKYCEDLCSLVSHLSVSNAKPPDVLIAPADDTEPISGHITIEEMMKNAPQSFDGTNNWRKGFTDVLRGYTRLDKHELRSALTTLPLALSGRASKQHEKDYIKQLDTSIRALEAHRSPQKDKDACSQLSDTLQEYKADIGKRLEVRLDEAASVVWRVTAIDPVFSKVIRHCDILPHISPRWFLQQLAFGKVSMLGPKWRTLLQQIAALWRDRQHMDRLIKASSNDAELLNELQTIERYKYDDSLFADTVLVEIEQDICLRANQLETARRMRDPANKENAVMQLNMGEGKSSVIIPILAASLAQGKSLVRVFVGRHQSAQMMDTMTAAIGGLMNRSVFRMPYNRDSKLTDKEIKKVGESMAHCVKTGGVLLLQPEHHQSLMLSTCLNDDTVRTRSYMSLIKYLRSTCRDIIDECDELLSPRQELLYTIGTPGPVDFAPDRWVIIQGLLGIMAKLANPRKQLTTTDDVLYHKDQKRSDSYPNFCFFSFTSVSEVLTEVARDFIIDGIPGFPTRRYPGPTKLAIKMFITERHPPRKYKKTIERLGQSARSAIALVRGCITGDILRAALLKRWRVDYGCDFSRTPSTRLAVPFAAKDVPKLRAEFSNVDLVIVLTQLSYYHGGLREQDVRDLIEHMCAADDGHDVYRQWVKASKMLLHLPELKIINLQDDEQFHKLLFPNIRYSVKAINYFLSRLVFPTELSAFSQHMAASGWDLAEKTRHPKTGFSGTADQCALLPLDMKQQNLPSEAHTDALVLNNILHSDNTVVSVHSELQSKALDGEDLLENVIKDGRIRVMIDVGAQILKLSNKQVAERWLEKTKDKDIKAVVFFNESEVISVLDGSGVTPLKASMYSKNMDACAVFLDEAHTRGTDLRLPLKYKAAVTLGPGLTKDRVAQACMRMRSLGKGQALVFYVSFEVENNVRKLLRLPDEQPIAIEHIIQWSIAQTHTSITRQIPLWAKQGCRYKKQNKGWRRVLNIKYPTAAKYEGIEKLFTENGINSVEKSYAPQPRQRGPSSDAQSLVSGETEDEESSSSRSPRSESSETSSEEGFNLDGLDREFVNALTKRCKAFGCADTVADDLDETCEREVAPEVEDEKQVCKPPKPKATIYTGNKALESFIQTGKIKEEAQGLERAFASLHRTKLANMLNKLNFPPNLLVSRDFAKAVDIDDPADHYQQHVAFLLHLKPTLLRQGLHQVVVIISQQDAEQYWEMISAKNSYVSFHSYNAKVMPRVVHRPTRTKVGATHDIYPADDGHASTYPTAIRIALDLFAGQLYFESYDEYIHVSSFLGLAYFKEAKGLEVDPDGFIPPSERHKIPSWHRDPNQLWDTFDSSPVPFFKHFLGVVRGHGAGIEHTHMGRILDGHRLGAMDFPGTFRIRGPADVVEEEKSDQGKRRRGEEDAGANGEPAAKRLCSEEQAKREEADTKIKKEEDETPVFKKIKTEVKEEEVKEPMGKLPQAPVKKTGKRKRQAEE